ncbi:MAG: DUF3592 domain-containing protein [Lentisphaeria bacterium]|nr:DUF3592 domain-containing protein [Lentisphaeria bacterium]
MPYGDSECKTFFSRWLPPTIFSGVFFNLGVVGFADLNSRGDSAALPLLLSFVAIAFIFWLIFFWRVRFERDSAVIWYCSFFPSRIDYAEVSGMRCVCGDAKHPGVPSHVEFFLKNGKEKRWSLNLFSETVRGEIVQELESRIQISAPANPLDGNGEELDADAGKELQDVTAWAEKTCRPHRAEMITVCAVGALMLVLGIWRVCEQLAWDERVRAWDKVDGIILRNTTKRVRSGKHTRNVADVEYEYTYKGTRCTGTRIVYDSDTFPKLKPGAHQQVIVNPEDPRDAAIMFWYSGYWWLMRYTDCMFFGLIFLIMSGIFTSLVTRKVPAVPESLKKYLKTFSQEQLQAAWKRERFAVTPALGLEMNRPMEYREDFRYGIIREHKTLFSKIVFALVFLAGVALAFAVPLVWLGVAITGTVIFFLFFPWMTVFDFQEKKIYRCRRFHPEKFASIKFVSFSEIDHLSVSDSVQSKRNRSGRRIGLFAVKQDGTQVPICGAVYRNLGVLLELLPELAEKMGHLPILFY